MNTEALISLLARGPVEADLRTTPRRISLATAAGLLLAVGAMWSVMGPRPDIASAAAIPMFWLKFLVPLGLAAAFFVACSRLSRPGDRAGGAWKAVTMMLAVLWAAAAISLWAAPTAQRASMVEGTSSWSCVGSIALLAMPLFVCVLLAIRGLAPTRPTWAGAAAGGLAGSVAALVYAVHCNEMTLPFVAVWYMLGIATPAVLGSVIGPKLLRWT